MSTLTLAVANDQKNEIMETSSLSSLGWLGNIKIISSTATKSQFLLFIGMRVVCLVLGLQTTGVPKIKSEGINHCS